MRRKIVAAMMAALMLMTTACGASSNTGTSGDDQNENIEMVGEQKEAALQLELMGDVVKISNADDQRVFTNDGVVEVTNLSTDGKEIELRLNAAAIQGFSVGGDVEMYVLPNEQTAPIIVGSYQIPVLETELDASEGVVATNISREVTVTGASAAFYMDFPEGTSINNVNVGNAVLGMVAGDGYYVDEFAEPEVSLDEGMWSEGKYIFQFDDASVEKLFTRAVVRGSESDVYSEGGPD